MEALKRLFTGKVRRDLDCAREEAREAHCALNDKLRDARERGLTVVMSQEALERIRRIEPAR